MSGLAEFDTDDMSEMLPLKLIKSQLIPPAPNRFPSAIDWLPDFGGLSWIAYGASSLLVISHFPSPRCQEETFIGTIFEQVIETPRPTVGTAFVRAVAWSPSLPSEGEIAFGSGNTIFVYASGSKDGTGSFCWRQISGLIQSSEVEVIKWTRSGDGLIAAGSEVVLWRKQSGSWEAAWRSNTEYPQTMASTTWSIEGLAATATGYGVPQVEGSSTIVLEDRKRVSVYYGQGAELVKAELFHPQPVTMLQWRPLVPKEDAPTFGRDVLLTCSLDGAVRLWSEIDSGRPRKPIKDLPGQKSIRSFHVVAVIEVNHILKGTLSMDTHFIWATEVEDTGTRLHFSPYGSEHDVVGKCEWLVGLGPQNSLSLWAIHCLDDALPLRFPRVSLWKMQTVRASTTVTCHETGSSIPANQSILVQAVVYRNGPFGPPTMCSLIELLPDNIISWSHLYREVSIVADVGFSKEPSTKNDLSCHVGVLNKCGHTGRILQVALHPCTYEIEIAVSLDSNGLLLFWSVSAISNPILSEPTLSHPSWKLLGQLVSGDLSTTAQYTTLRWAPSLLNNDPLLLLGYADGIDMFAIKISENNRDKMANYKICTISFEGHCMGDVPDHIFAVPLASENSKNTVSSSFILLSIWIKEFRAVSWNVVLCTSDLLGSTDTPKGWRFKSAFGNTKYNVVIKPCSSSFPNEFDQITSFAVICPNNFICSQVKTPLCQLATGCSDGSVKLWRTSCTDPNGQNSDQMLVPWELVGICTSHQGPVHAVSLSSNGTQMATITKVGSSSNSTLHIWESKYLDGTGRFLLEDKMTLEGDVMALEWLAIGNGQLLGVCLQDELRIYACQRSSSLALMGPRTLSRVWVCVATSSFDFPAQHFMWGPRVGAVVVHDGFLSLFSRWTVCDRNMLLGESSERNGTVANIYFPVKNETELCDFVVRMSQEKIEHGGKSSIHNILEIVEKMNEPLPVYHPRTLFLSLCSGGWKRAYAVMKHLVEHLNSGANSGVHEKGYNLGKSCIVIPQVHPSQYLEETVATKMSSEGLQWSTHLSSGPYGAESQGSFPFSSYTMSNASSENSEESDFTRTLDKFHDIQGISEKSRTELLAIVDLLGEIKDSHWASLYESLDGSGRRFWVAVKFQMHLLQKNARLAGSELIVHSGLIVWAFMSDCQDNLFNSLLPSEPTWQEMRSLGVGYWYRDVTSLRTRIEKLARSQYLKNRDPKDCALLYLALNRLQVLAGLFKISKHEKDKPLVGFLARNFQEERNKAAALKNAYVLMGKHQLQLAIAFFILGGDPSSAVSICAKNFGDEQLALVICRLLEGYGGTLERNLISDVLLPSAIEKEDHWLVSLFEWILGNYSKSFWNVLGLKEDPTQRKSNDPSNYMYALSDPNIGQYCAFLAVKSSIKNSVGEAKAATMGRWASLMTSSALKRCGHPFEALESLQSSSINIESKDQFTLSDSGNVDIFHGKQRWTAVDTSDWIVDDVACDLEAHAKIGLAMFYISKMMREHPNWADYNICKINKGEVLLDTFEHKLKTAFSILENKFSLASHDLACMTLLFSSSHGLFFLGYHMSHGFLPQEFLHSSYFYPLLREQLMKTTRDTCSLLVRYIVVCCLACPASKPAPFERFTSIKHRCSLIHPLDFSVQYLIDFINNMRPLLEYHTPGLFEDIQVEEIFSIFDLLEYLVDFASAWAQKECRGLVLMIRPIINAFRNKQIAGVKVTDLRVIKREIRKLVTADVCCDAEGTAPQNITNHGVNRTNECSLPEDEKWRLIGVCLWGYLCHFINGPVNMLEASRVIEESMGTLLKTTMTYVSSSLTRLLESDLRQKIEKSLPVPTLTWLEKSNQSQPHKGHEYLTKGVGGLDISEQSNTSLFETLWLISVDPKEASEVFVREAVHYLQSISKQRSRSWSSVHKSILSSHGNGETSNPVDSRKNHAAENCEKWIYGNAHIFHSPKVLYKSNGELMEAMCVNSISQNQVALASNRKGLIFFNWGVEDALKNQEYIWSKSDWPLNGWARSESTPDPTCVSLAVELGSKKCAHRGGGATVGVGPLARPGRDLTGGGAFGIPGYAGIGASGLGWEESEDFEIVDPPATVKKISTRALCSHPSGPFFLVGSSNTHIYLWKFGKNRATATYGVLPARNVPPPYALASISEVQFDQCGHRFASAASDGTICTWQLEVGGRSNVRPTDSCRCFSGYALDVEYVSGSGSVIAGAGYSSNGVNVVIWDTLAPPTSSQASLTCHEGGACSLSVFDNDIGSGSISPMIVTGGKEGDVGLHDFRFIATGRSKRHKSSGFVGENQSTQQHPSGMLWYIPKAHQGNVTRISTIPYTSLFLTGSKDGDVKLWDARKQELVFHWQKLHERHTFLQSSSQGFGGIVRAAVTDIHVLSNGFLTCGGDGTVKLIQLRN